MFFFFQAEDGIRDGTVTGVQTCALPISNFRSVLQSPTFRRSLYDSVVFTVGTQIIVLVGSTILALALKEHFRGRGLVRFLILLPWVAPVSLGAIGWKWILDSLYSVINWV